MISLTSSEEEEAFEYIIRASEVAASATCERHHCGSVIVKDGEIIGQGFNSPPGGLEEQRRCSLPKDTYHKKVTDKTCCIHAEERAVMDALRRNPDKISGSRLYFTRIDAAGKPIRSGKPYCTICSKRVLDAGVAEFVLWHEEGVCVYDTREYNLLSFQYSE